MARGISLAGGCILEYVNGDAWVKVPFAGLTASEYGSVVNSLRLRGLVMDDYEGYETENYVAIYCSEED